MLNKLSFILLRRNRVPICWATFAILPEKSGLLATKGNFMLIPCFIPAFWPAQYFIWMATMARFEVQKFLRHAQVLLNLSLREIVIVDLNNLTGESSNPLRMHYFNMYYIKTQPIGVDSSQNWYTIDCLPLNCLDKFGEVSKTVVKLNKYFWTSRKKLVYQHMNNFRTSSIRRDLSLEEHREIARSTSMSDFVSFWILQDEIGHDLRNATSLYFIPRIKRFGSEATRGFSFHLYDVKKYSFASCYNVKASFDMISALTNPLDGASWTFLGISFAMVITILTALRTRSISNGLYTILGISLENSVLSRTIFEVKSPRGKHDLIGIYGICGLDAFGRNDFNKLVQNCVHDRNDNPHEVPIPLEDGNGCTGSPNFDAVRTSGEL